MGVAHGRRLDSVECVVLAALASGWRVIVCVQAIKMCMLERGYLQKEVMTLVPLQP